MDEREGAVAAVDRAVRLERDDPDAVGFESAYYDTCRMVNVTGIATRPQVVARGVNGLEVWVLNDNGLWKPPPTSSALSDANG